MASYKDWVANGGSKLDWAMPFQRTGGFPLDRTDIFSSLDDAELYASGGADSRGLSGSSYVGQIITVWENGSVKAYQIQEDRSLKELGSDKSEEVPFFNLTELGMPNFTAGTYSVIETDTSEIMAAIDKGVVRLSMLFNGYTAEATVPGSRILYNDVVLGYYITFMTMVGTSENYDLLNAQMVIRDGSVEASLKVILPDADDLSDGTVLQVVNGEWTTADPPQEKLTLGHAIHYDEEGRLAVKMADDNNNDNTLPVSAATMESTVGNIEILLKTI